MTFILILFFLFFTALIIVGSVFLFKYLQIKFDFWQEEQEEKKKKYLSDKYGKKYWN